MFEHFPQNHNNLYLYKVEEQIINTHIMYCNMLHQQSESTCHFMNLKFLES